MRPQTVTRVKVSLIPYSSTLNTVLRLWVQLTAANAYAFKMAEEQIESTVG